MEVTSSKQRFNFELKPLLLVFCLMLGGCSASRNQDSLDNAESIQPTTTPQTSENNQQSTVLSQPSPSVHREDQPAKVIAPSPSTIAPSQAEAPPTVVAPSSQADTSPSVAVPSQADTTPPVIVTPEAATPPAAVPAKEESPSTATYDALDEFGQSKFSLKSSDIFASANLPNSPISFDERDLLTVLVNTRNYFINHNQQDPKVLRGGLLENQGITVADIMETLNFMIQVLQEDLTANRITRLKNPQFIEEHFQAIRWSPYDPEGVVQEQLRITQYAIFTHPGSRTKTSIYDTPLYRLNSELNADNIETRYSKQDVVSGVYELGGEAYGRAIPIAYLTRDGLEEALLQGTILINFEDGSSSYFNVDINNGIAYVHGTAQKAQKRYWYFKEVESIKGYGYQSQAKIPVLPGVTFAGDILNIGLGKIVVLDNWVEGEKRLQIGVIADTGGAFSPNLYQLDYLAGIFPSRAAFSDHARQYSDYATAYVLVRRR